MEIPTNSYCNACYKAYTPNDTFCNGCGYPLQGTPQEQDFFLSERNVKEIDLSSMNEAVRKAGNSLFWIAGLTAVSSLFILGTVAEEDRLSVLIANIFLFVAFLALGFLSKSKPTAALISGLSLYLIIQVLNAIDNPLTIFSGIIFKVIIIGYLIKGIKAVLDADKLKKELNIE